MTLKITQAAREAAANAQAWCDDMDAPEMVQAFQRAMNHAADEALERAAAKVDEFREAHERKRETTRRFRKEFAAHIDACANIATAIRALKGQQP